MDNEDEYAGNFCLLYFLFAVVLVNVKLLYGLPIDCTAEI